MRLCLALAMYLASCAHPAPFTTASDAGAEAQRDGGADAEGASFGTFVIIIR